MEKYYLLDGQGNRREVVIKTEVETQEVKAEMQNTRPPIELVVAGVAGWAVAIGLAIADILGG